MINPMVTIRMPKSTFLNIIGLLYDIEESAYRTAAETTNVDIEIRATKNAKTSVSIHDILFNHVQYDGKTSLEK